MNVLRWYVAVMVIFGLLALGCDQTSSPTGDSGGTAGQGGNTSEPRPVLISPGKFGIPLPSGVGGAGTAGSGSGGSVAHGGASAQGGSAGSSGGIAGSAWVCIPDMPTGVGPTTAVCGDGFLGGFEQCDDGNTLGADACGPTCQVTPELVSPPLQTQAPVTRINSGGDAVGYFGADRFVTGGSASSTTAVVSTTGVTNAAPAEVYQTERWGDFSYTLAGLTAAATYTVRLHFAEIYFGSAGSRLFNVAINGTRVLENFDIFAVAGANRAVVRDFAAVASSTGQIVLDFSGVVDNAKLSALELIPPPGLQGAPALDAVARINSGGDAVGSFAADQFVSGGSAYSNGNAITTSGMANAAPEAVYQSERYGDFSYTLSGLTPAASYTVRLHFAEIFYTTSGSRVFNVAINGTPVLESFDIYAVAGANTALVRDFGAVATGDGQIVVSFTSVIDNAKLSGLELFPTASQSGPVASRTLGTGRHPLAAGCNQLGVAFSERSAESSALYLSRFKPAGARLGSVQVAQTKVQTPDPGVAALPGDDFVVAWTDFDADELGISLRKVVAGVPQGNAITANEGTAFSQSESDIVFDGTELVVAWVDSRDAVNGPDLRYRLFTSDLKPLTGDQVLANTSAVEDNVVLAGQNGHWAAAWRAGAQGMETIEVQSGGSHWTVGPFLPGATDDRPALAFLDTSHWALAFTEGSDPDQTGVANVSRLHGAVLDAAYPGTVESFSIPQTVAPWANVPNLSQTEPSLAVLTDRLVVGWHTSLLNGDASAEELWTRELKWAPAADGSLVVDVSSPDLPLIASESRRGGDQSQPALLSSSSWPQHSIVSAWQDSGQTFGAASGTPDVALQFSQIQSTCATVSLTSNEPASYDVTGQYAVQGETIIFTASAACNGSPQYRFVMQPPDGAYMEVQPWGPSNTFTWPTAGLTMGYWNIEVLVRDQPTGDYQTYTQKQILLTDAAACTEASVVSDHASGYGVTGDVIHFTATSTCAGQARYKFWILPPNGTSYIMARDWSTSDTLTWDTTGQPSGYWTLIVWVSDSVFYTSWLQAYGSSSFILNDYAACTSASLVSDDADYHAPVGQVVHWTASSSCAGPAEYRFVFDDPSGVWTGVQEWSSSNTFTWDTANQPTGFWNMQVWVRDAPFYDYEQAYGSATFTLTSP